MPRSTLSSGAVVATGSVNVHGSVAQPVIGTPRSAEHGGFLGFWYQPSNVVLNVERHQTTATLADESRLSQSYPNPVGEGSPSRAREAVIRFVLSHAGPVTLTVSDLLGRNERRLVDAWLPAGSHLARFDARRMPSGMYLYRLHANGRSVSRLLIVMR